MPLLKQGSSGPDVTALQSKLKELGFDPAATEAWGRVRRRWFLLFNRSRICRPTALPGDYDYGHQ